MRKLQQTKAGCKLLSRLGKGRTLGDDPNDPMLNFGVLKKEEQVKKNIETKSKIEKRPPSALTVGQVFSRLVIYSAIHHHPVYHNYFVRKTVIFIATLFISRDLPMEEQKDRLSGTREYRVNLRENMRDRSR